MTNSNIQHDDIDSTRTQLVVASADATFRPSHLIVICHLLRCYHFYYRVLLLNLVVVGIYYPLTGQARRGSRGIPHIGVVCGALCNPLRSKRRGKKKGHLVTRRRREIEPDFQMRGSARKLYDCLWEELPNFPCCFERAIL